MIRLSVREPGGIARANRNGKLPADISGPDEVPEERKQPKTYPSEMKRPSQFARLVRSSRVLAPYYGKTHGALVASGMAAIEVALAWLGILPGDEIIVPNNCCHHVPAAVARMQGIPVFAGTDGSLQLDPFDVPRRLTPRTRALIAVHQYGLPCPVAKVAAHAPCDLPIIEDAAQSFELKSMGSPIGRHSQVVVTSFGQTKPLNLGGGGAVFVNDPSIETIMRRNAQDDREGEVLPFSCIMHPNILRNLKSKILRAQARVRNRREVAEELVARFTRFGCEVWSGRAGDEPSWHRLPILTVPSLAPCISSAPALIANIAHHSHAVKCSDLPMFRRFLRSPPGTETTPRILLRIDDPNLARLWTLWFTRTNEVTPCQKR